MYLAAVDNADEDFLGRKLVVSTGSLSGTLLCLCVGTFRSYPPTHMHTIFSPRSLVLPYSVQSCFSIMWFWVDL